MRQASTLLLLGLLLCLPIACEPVENNPTPSSQKLSLPFTINEPESWQYVETCRLDINTDGDEEWIIMYYFDQASPPGTKQHGNPIAAYAYRPDENRPPNFFAHKLNAPGNDYLCECRCVPIMDDALSVPPGPELVLGDTCDGERMRLTIFQWDQTKPAYLPVGHFHGHDISINPDTVIVEERQATRAQLAIRQTYHPTNGYPYYLDDQGTLVPPAEQEIVFSHEEPKDVTLSPYPEKTVLAFYNHYTDPAKASAYFAEGAWEQLGQCDTDWCGCAGPRAGVAHVRVTSLRFIEDPSLGSDQARVGATVICEHPGGMSDGETPVQWYLIRMGDRWQISSRE